MSGFSAHHDSGSHAPSTNSTLSSITGQTVQCWACHRGACTRSCDLLPALAPFCDDDGRRAPFRDADLVQHRVVRPCAGTRCWTLRQARGGLDLAPGSRLSRPAPSLDSAPRGALRPFLGHSAKMPRIRFYNRRFASRAPMSKHHLWRLPADPPWETRRRSASRSLSNRARFARRHKVQDPVVAVRSRRRTTLRSSGLQRLARLTARSRLRVDWLPLSC
jgi:hypothetical protein